MEREGAITNDREAVAGGVARIPQVELLGPQASPPGDVQEPVDGSRTAGLVAREGPRGARISCAVSRSAFCAAS